MSYITFRSLLYVNFVSHCIMEQILQYIWQHRLWETSRPMTVSGEPLTVIEPGQINTDSGPDFFNAKIKIGNRVWAGDVEVHVKASDWYRHHHDRDNAYDSVILHVVEKDDMEVRYPTSNEVIPQLRISYPPNFVERCSRLLKNASDLPCSNRLLEIDNIEQTSWLTSLLYERLHDKCRRIEHLLGKTTSNREEVCYITLARALGTNINGDAFERLALSVPLSISGKHSDSLTVLESLLFGQAGLLDIPNNENEYYIRLQNEYKFLNAKFGLQSAKNLNWKMARMRPSNFPHRRIALLASFLHGGFKLLSRLMEAEDLDDVRVCFKRELTGYWSSHFNFNNSSVDGYRGLSEMTIDSLVINVAVPLLYYFGGQLNTRHGEVLQERAIGFLEKIKPERNYIVKTFTNCGIKCPDAFTSQSLIQLRKNYCDLRKCVFCRIGHKLLRKEVTARGI